MKKILTFTFIAMVLFLSSCKSEQYDFPNKGQPIEKIEFLSNPYANKNTLDAPMYNICSLEEECVDAFMQGLYSIETTRCITPPPTDYGLYIARVVYENGDVEMFGSRHIEFIAKGDTPKKIGEYCFDREKFEELFFQYAGTPDTWK